MKIIIFILSTFLYCFQIKAQSLPSKSDIIKTMKLVNDYWINIHPDPGNNQWARAAYFTGNMAFYKIYMYERYLEYANTWAVNNNWGLNGGISTRHADNHCCGQTYIDLYELDPEHQEYKIADIKESISGMVSSVKSDDWWWIDALYMAMPVFTRLGIMESDTGYFSKLYKLYSDTKYTRSLYNDSSGLWYRDESFAPPYETPNGFDSYWSRGNGWVLGAHARILQYLPETDPHRDEYINTFQDMAAALKKLQRDDGFWNVSLADPDDYGGPETSGTSFFTYGIAWGINNGFLDSATYIPVVINAWNNLVSTAVHPDGKLGYVQGVGSNPASSQPVTYETTSDFGVGAFLLAGSEVVKLAAGSIPDTPYQLIDSVLLTGGKYLLIYFKETIQKSNAENISNYIISDNIEITDAILSGDEKIVTLSLNNVSLGKYKISFENIISNSGHEIDTSYITGFIISNIIEVTASGYQEGTTNFPENTIDFNLDTRWSQEGEGEWIMFELDTLKIVISVDIAFYNGNSRFVYFDIELSENGTDFIKAFSGESSGSTTELENFDFNDTKAKFVKIIGHGNSSNMWNSITEVNIHTMNGPISSKENINYFRYSSTIYPNPVIDDRINICLSDYLKNKTIITINDILGKEVFRDYINKNEETNVISLNLNLKKGIYFVTIGENKSKSYTKIIVN